MVGPMPAMLRGLIDDAALFPPGNAPLETAVPAHRGYRQSWYESMVGPLLVPQSRLADLDRVFPPGRGELRIGVIVDGDLDRLAADAAALDPRITVAHYESRHAVEALAARDWDRPVYAEIPLDQGLDEALDALRPTGFTPKFRTGGLDAALFPAPAALAAAMAGCRRRGLRFKLTAGLHRAVRHHDPAAGFTHHGFLNVLVAAADTERNASVEDLTATLASTDEADLAARARRVLHESRALWTGFGSCSINEPLDDLLKLQILSREDRA